jgi:hypothetical protein
VQSVRSKGRQAEPRGPPLTQDLHSTWWVDVDLQQSSDGGQEVRSQGHLEGEGSVVLLSVAVRDPVLSCRAESHPENQHTSAPLHLNLNM